MAAIPPITERDVRHYQGTHEYRGTASGLWELIQRFDNTEGDYTIELMNRYNNALAEDTNLKSWILDLPEHSLRPRQILFLDASHDKLPTGLEATRIMAHAIAEHGWSGTTRVLRIDTREQLEEAIAAFPTETLVMSMCVNKRVYNVSTVHELEAGGTICVPGAITAPGSIFSDKLATYRLLENPPPKAWDWLLNHPIYRSSTPKLIAQYRNIDVTDLDAEGKARAIFDCTDKMRRELGLGDFFVKPREGGGGLGGFRLAVHKEGYLLPDLSKLTGDQRKGLYPSYITFDPTNEAQLRELGWIFRMFERDPGMAKTYLWRTLDQLRDQYGVADDIEALRAHIEASNYSLETARRKQIIPRATAVEELSEAISVFENLISVTYQPLVCEHIQFGTWGLRVHVRFSTRGPMIESIYYRIFQLALGPKGIGYVGADNISNKLTGALETLRCGPPLPLMIEAIGGEEQLEKCFINAIAASLALAEQLPEELRTKVPLRSQLDISPVNAIIVEGNADTARGPGLGTRWDFFVETTREWLEDGLKYYTYRKTA